MANELRVRALAIGGLVEDNPLAAGATTLTSAGLAGLPVVGSTEHAVIILDPDGIDGAPEVVYVTAHTVGASSATIVRGREGTTDRAHAQDTPWIHGPTVKDFDGAGGGVGLIGYTEYAAGSDTSYGVTATSLADVDATNLAVPFVVPPSGIVLVRLAGAASAGTGVEGSWGLRDGTTDLAERLVLRGGSGYLFNASLRIEGLTPGAAKTYKWAARVTSGTMSLFHGPTNGSLAIEVWAVNV